MALFLEYSDKVKNKKYPITKPVRQHASALYNALEKLVPKNNLKGLKDLATLKKYNIKGANSKNNGEDTNIKYITTDDAIKRLQRKGYGVGDAFIQNFLKKCVDKSTSQEKVSPVEPPKPTTNAVKPKNVEPTKILRAENRVIKESFDDDGNPYYDYVNDYDERYVFNEFMSNPNGKQSWTPLINPDMYAKALREFTQYGKLVKFPAKYVYQWMGIILKNTAILRANTNIAGHSSYFPYDDYADFLESYFSDRETYVDSNRTKIEITPEEAMRMCNGEHIFISEAVDKYGQTYFPWVSQDDADRMAAQQDFERSRAKFNEMYGDIMEYIEQFNREEKNQRIEIDNNSGKIFWVANEFDVLYHIGFDDWMIMPDGTDAFTDFGMEPLERVLSEYSEELPPEKVLVLVNRALDVYHMRGDLSSIFVVGGSKALSRIAEEIEFSKGKKIYLSEQSIKKLYEYYTQLNLPFNDTSGKGYDDKLNYEHFVDWLEYYGKYGQLEGSGIKEDDIQATFVDNNIASAFKYFFHNESEDGYFIEDIGEALRNLYYTASVDEDYLRLYFAFDEEMYENPLEDIGEYIEDIGLNIEDIDDVESILTDEGIEKLRDLLEAEFKNRIIDNGIPYSLEINDRGLIYIEREITMPNAMSPNIPRDEKNYFEYLMNNNFNGVGQCWTFMKGKGEAYCGVGYGGDTDYILLQGWVDPRSINWQETLMRNSWSMNEEHEIFINSGYLVEIDKITLNRNYNNNYGKNILPKPILIQT